ncbi:hypothetical protein SAMN04488028_10262 [Reichenbachiella agariperforans]|uniref:Uncharacterized protein n=1 Tax=Reichenbachiella agariperforans TaxID=156994 RepID=A0A1M6N216_REIAG|nr:hypothetical protein [Reichenbachiella agariperforans]SHJ89712.1 hypothetical protein SAMN04488028_10262 [Reichenbachiella agariperforans]
MERDIYPLDYLGLYIRWKSVLVFPKDVNAQIDMFSTYRAKHKDEGLNFIVGLIAIHILAGFAIVIVGLITL